MAGLPQVQQVRLEQMRAAENSGQPATAPKPKPSAVVSMAPNGTQPTQPAPVASPPANEPPLDLNAFAVDPVPAQPGAPASAPASDPAASAQPPAAGAQPTPAAREGEDDLPRPEQGTPEYRYWLRWKSVAGMYEKSKSDLRELRTAHATLQGKYDLLTEQFRDLRQAPPQPAAPTPSAPTPVNVDELLSAEERETYKDALPVVEKMARSIAQGMVESAVQPLKEKLEALGVDTTNLSKVTQTNEENMFIQRVRDKITNMGTITQTPEWQAYMEQRVPFGGGKTFGQTLIDAHNARNFEGVVEIFSNFQAPQKPNIAELETPTARRDGSDPVQRTAQKPVLKWSERVKAGEDFRKGRIPRERLDASNKAYADAEKEGRIDYNK